MSNVQTTIRDLRRAVIASACIFRFMNILIWHSLLLLSSWSTVSSDLTDQHYWGRQQRVPGDPRDHPYWEGVCMSVSMNWETGTLPLCGELCVYLLLWQSRHVSEISGCILFLQDRRALWCPHLSLDIMREFRERENSLREYNSEMNSVIFAQLGFWIIHFGWDSPQDAVWAEFVDGACCVCM